MALPERTGREARGLPRPAILGHRGAPREAPENTLAGLRRAVELALDGVLYDVRACAGGEMVLLADPTLDRTSDASGLLASRSLAELFGVDAGGWHDRRFAGEPLALLDEALELDGPRAGPRPLHLAFLREPGLAAAVAAAARSAGRRTRLLVASRQRAACLEARDLGLRAALVVDRLSEELRELARAEGLAAVAAPIRAWRAEGERPWPCERWSLDVDDPGDLLWACRRPLEGLTTRAGPRALALRALAALAPAGDAHPLEAPRLGIRPRGLAPGRAAWCGSWDLSAGFTNPLERRARVRLELVVQRGTFEAGGLPVETELAPGARMEARFHLTGGSWSPGGDPLLVARLEAPPGPEGAAVDLALEAPLRRERELVLGHGVVRLELLCEHPGDPPASMTLRRSGGELLLSIERSGGLAEPRAIAHLDGRDYEGGTGLRLPLPPDADARAGGLAFSAGIVGRARGPAPESLRTRRWAGGLPAEADAGVPGRLRTRR